MTLSKVRVTITLRNHHHISFIVDDNCRDLGEIMAELIRGIGMSFHDVLNVSYKVIK